MWAVVETSTSGGDYTKAYVLDLVGNRLTLIESKEGQSPVTTISTYDARDRLLTETTGAVTLNYGYNANGSLTTKHEGSVLQSEQVWDVRGRLAGLKDGSGNWLSQYRYTPDGIRSAATEGGTTTLHVIDVLGPSGYAQVIEERSAAWVVVGSYVYGPALDPLSQWRDGQGANLYLADGHSGVRQAVSLAGVVLLTQRFDAFGVTVATAGTLANVIGYRGERFDSTLGQYYLRARFYDPMSGRFTGMDPYAGNYGDPLQAMRYGYAGANPVGAMDPSGKFVAAVAGLAVGAFFGLGIRQADASRVITGTSILAKLGRAFLSVGVPMLGAAFTYLLFAGYRNAGLPIWSLDGSLPGKSDNLPNQRWADNIIAVLGQYVQSRTDLSQQQRQKAQDAIPYIASTYVEKTRQRMIAYFDIAGSSEVMFGQDGNRTGWIGNWLGDPQCICYNWAEAIRGSFAADKIRASGWRITQYNNVPKSGDVSLGVFFAHSFVGLRLEPAGTASVPNKFILDPWKRGRPDIFDFDKYNQAWPISSADSSFEV